MQWPVPNVRPKNIYDVGWADDVPGYPPDFLPMEYRRVATTPRSVPKKTGQIAAEVNQEGDRLLLFKGWKDNYPVYFVTHNGNKVEVTVYRKSFRDDMGQRHTKVWADYNGMHVEAIE